MKNIFKQIKQIIIPSDVDYFQMFVVGSKITLRAAEALQIAFADANLNYEELRKIKEIEHEGDRHVHASMRVIDEAFITPIDQTDFVEILKAIENVTDHIDYVAAHCYMLNISTGDRYYEAFIETMVKACRKMVELMETLHHFKKLDLKAMNQLVADINDLEEVADRIYLESMRELFTNNVDSLTIISKKEIYQRMEDVLDRVEDVADAVQSLMVAKL